MPGFAETIDQRERWDVINFVHARAAAVQPLALQPQVTAGPAPPAPDFTFEQHGNEATLRQRLEQGPLLLMFYEPQRAQRLQQLAGVENRLAAAGLRLLALPLEGEEAATPTPLPDFTATADDVAAAYRLFMDAGAAAPCEFLVDRDGFLRARWKAGTPPGLPDEATLVTQLDRLAELPLQPQTAVHAH